MKIIGRIITGLPVLFLAFDGAVKLANPSFVTEASAKLGLPAGISVGLGIVLLASLALYLARRTALLGAVLLTGYLGGAVCAQLRIEAPLFSTMLFPVYFGVVVWVALYLRSPQLRKLVAASLS
jgi:hypothetical protein